MSFETGLEDTVAWYFENAWWWRPIKDSDPRFRAYYDAGTANAAPDVQSPHCAVFHSRNLIPAAESGPDRSSFTVPRRTGSGRF